MKWATLIANRNPARGLEYYLEPVCDLYRWAGIPTDIYADVLDWDHVSRVLPCREISVDSVFRGHFHGDVIAHEYDRRVIGPVRRMGKTWPIIACWVAKYWILCDAAAYMTDDDDIVCWLDAGHVVTYFADGSYKDYRHRIRDRLYTGDGWRHREQLEAYVRKNTNPVLVAGSLDADCGLDHVDAWSRLAVYGCFFAVRSEYVEMMFEIVTRTWGQIVASGRVTTDEALLYLGVKEHHWTIKDYQTFFRLLYGFSKGD